MDTPHEICSAERWNEARRELLAEEKRFSQLREQLSERRRALPWVRVQQDYRFESTQGPRSLKELFGDKSQLLVYHFMFAPEWDQGCPNCSFFADSFDANVVHLAQCDVSFVAISRAPVQKLSAYSK